MNSIKRLVFIFVMCMSSSVQAEIYTASSVEEINNTLLELLEKRNPEKTLTILPLEKFMLRPVSPALNIKDEKFRTIIERVSKKAKLSKRAYLEQLVLTEYEQRLSDPKLTEFIKNIQEKNAPFIVVTRNFSGSFNKIPYLEVWTWAYLLEKGIDLSKNPLGSRQIIFNKGHKKIKGTYPTFYRGLLSCNSEGQGNSPQGLIASLLAVNLKWMPDIVYVIDSEESYIKSIEQQFKSLKADVQVVGFVYAPEENVQSDQISAKEFLKFWEGVVDKLNNVSRKEINKNKEDPYEQ